MISCTDTILVQVARQGANSPRARFTTRAASQRQNGSTVPQRSGERNLQAAQPGYGIARRPVATDLFFPGQASLPPAFLAADARYCKDT